jgi:hypothetical protein
MQWELFIYRLPANPSRARVAVWRELRRLGALPLQQSVIVVPHSGDLLDTLTAIQERIINEAGVVYRYTLDNLTAEQHGRLVSEWNALRDHEYAEIVEECETKFQREIEFELFRNNLTGSEAEEIEADLDKIRAWFERVSARDWFEAAGRDSASAAIETCQTMLDDFVERVYLAESADGVSLEPPARLSWHDIHPVSDTPEEPDGTNATREER